MLRIYTNPDPNTEGFKMAEWYDMDETNTKNVKEVMIKLQSKSIALVQEMED